MVYFYESAERVLRVSVWRREREKRIKTNIRLYFFLSIYLYDSIIHLYLRQKGVCYSVSKLRVSHAIQERTRPGINAWAYVCKDVIAATGIGITTAKPIYYYKWIQFWGPHDFFKCFFLAHLHARRQLFTAIQTNNNAISQVPMDDFICIILCIIKYKWWSIIVSINLLF